VLKRSIRVRAGISWFVDISRRDGCQSHKASAERSCCQLLLRRLGNLEFPGSGVVPAGMLAKTSAAQVETTNTVRTRPCRRFRAQQGPAGGCRTETRRFPRTASTSSFVSGRAMWVADFGGFFTKDRCCRWVRCDDMNDPTKCARGAKQFPNSA